MSEKREYTEIPIGEIVAKDFRAAEIFKNAGIDFCCGGKKSLDNACNEKSIDSSLIVKRLKELDDMPVNQNQNFIDWDISFLADYIVNTHHRYVLKSLPDLVFYTQKIASVHSEHHPELILVADLFEKVSKELLGHLKKEEDVLFPAIKEVLKNNSVEARATIKSEISRMNDEHEFAGGTMDRINEITSNYLVPEDGCNTYNVAFKLLHQFEDDLHVHVHLENNILYPKALSL
jgi:regulator of cell morphogenesis and NO signaling